MLNDTMGTQPVKSWLGNSISFICQQIKLEFLFCFVFGRKLWVYEFAKVLNSDWNTALEETWVQLRQGEARQLILMLKKTVMAVSENPFWARSILEMATVSIPGWSQVPLRQCFSNLGGEGYQIICYLYRHLGLITSLRILSIGDAAGPLVL